VTYQYLPISTKLVEGGGMGVGVEVVVVVGVEIDAHLEGMKNVVHDG